MTDIERAASAIVAARRAHIRIPALPRELAPASLEEAYAIQDSSMRLLGPPGGWKTTTTGAELRCSPIPASAIFPTPATLPAGAPCKIEVEIGIMIGNDLEEPQNAATIHRAIASIHPAIELVLSRFNDPVPAAMGLADCQSNEAVIVGNSIEGWARSDLASIQMTMSIGGKVVAADSDRVSIDAMLPALAWLSNQALARGLPLRKGHLIITGARLKAPAPRDPCTITVEVDGRAQAISLELVD